MNGKEIVIYSIVAISSLTLLAYTVHMFVGGLVSERTEDILMWTVVAIGAVAMGFMGRSIVRRRRLHQLYMQQLQAREKQQSPEQDVTER